MDTHEKLAYSEGYRCVAGVDEAGRGPLAGPVVAAAVIFPPHYQNPEINDSKKLTASKREELYKVISADAVAVGVGVAEADVIDRINILKASLLAMKEAVLELSTSPDFLLIDGLYQISVDISQKALVKGDQLSVSIAAASIIAKVSRDRIMEMYHRQFPRYNFQQNKGYGTAEHRKIISEIGFCKNSQAFVPSEKSRRQSNGIRLVMTAQTESSHNLSTGKAGEKIAAAFLKQSGYRIVETNYRCPIGEIDIVAREKKEWVFVEVKARKSGFLGYPEQAVDAKKQRKMSKLALWYLKENKLDDVNARFDVVAIQMLPCGNEVRLIKNAFDFVPF